MLNVIILIICVMPIIYYIQKLKDFRIKTETMVIISLFSGMHFLLSKIQFIQYPQGGGINLLASLPILFVGVLYGTSMGTTCGLVSSLITLIGGQLFIVHPAQFLLDYILPSMILGLSGICGNKRKSKIFIGCFIAVILKVVVHVISGCVYFYEYVPIGWNPLTYSLIYNLTGEGIEAFLSSIVITIMPISKLLKLTKISNQQKAS